MRTVLIGFDSAWTDNRRNPGAIAAAVFEGACSVTFREPGLVSFAQAGTFIEDVASGADRVLIALDQPTIVANATGSRPVEKVAASLISALGGGVQPANIGRVGLFDTSAPGWRFLRDVGARQDPDACRRGETGRFLMEVFPALALPSLVPAIYRRGRAAKYNPANRDKFRLDDWRLVADGLAEATAGFPALSGWFRCAAQIARPDKSDQDMLDASICLAIAHRWLFAPRAASLILGDYATGYIVTPAAEPARSRLIAAARRYNVPVDDPGTMRAAAPITVAAEKPPRAAQQERPARPPVDGAPSARRVETDALYQLLARTAREGRTVTYGEVAASLGLSPHQGTMASLTRALRELSARNRINREPQIMALVVAKDTDIPGPGFFQTLGEAGADNQEQRRIFARERDRCFAFAWPDT